MRISDWSSDVCFDLAPGALPENRALAEEVLSLVDGLDGGFGRVAELRQAAFGLFRDSLEPGGQEMRKVISVLIEKALSWDEFDIASRAGQTQENVRLQIGKASCRERVCQYV